MRRIMLVAVTLALLLLLCGCEPMYTKEQLDEAYDEGYEDGFDDGKEEGYESGTSDGGYEGYDEAMADAARYVDNCVYEAAYSAGNYEELLGMIQSYLDDDGEYTYEDAQEAVNRLYYEFESIDHYCHEVRETKDPWQSTKQWNWGEPYPGAPWED